MLNSVTAGTC